MEGGKFNSTPIQGEAHENLENDQYAQQEGQRILALINKIDLNQANIESIQRRHYGGGSETKAQAGQAKDSAQIASLQQQNEALRQQIMQLGGAEQLAALDQKLAARAVVAAPAEAPQTATSSANPAATPAEAEPANAVIPANTPELAQPDYEAITEWNMR